MPRAGLTADSVTAAAAALADEIGLENLGMSGVAERLGVKTPSLYKHVAGQGDLVHRVAVLAMTEVADAIGSATQGRAGSDALSAAAQAMRDYVKDCPGRYAAGNAARPSGPADPLAGAVDRLLASLAAVLRGYQLDPSQEIHALRMLRSMVHGFATLEAAGGFQMTADVDDSFAWMISLVDQGLRADAGRQASHGKPRTVGIA